MGHDACPSSLFVFQGTSRVIDVGLRTRAFPGALRRAIQVRDRHCSIPGCTTPADRCEVATSPNAAPAARLASFAPADVTAALTGMVVGGVSPIGLPDGLPIWIDTRVMERERIVLGGGSRDIKVVGPPSLLSTVHGAVVVDGLAVGPDPG